MDGFAGKVVRAIQEARQSEIDNPTLDRWRFPNARADQYNPTEAAKILWFIQNNYNKLNLTADLLADDVSRDLLVQLFAFRALGRSTSGCGLIIWVCSQRPKR